MSIVVQKRPSPITWSQNPCNYRLYSSVAAGDATVYFEVRVMFRFIAGGFTELVRFNYYPVAGVADIDVAAVVDSALRFDLPDLPTPASTPYTGSGQTGYFYLSFREITSSPAGAFDDTENDFEILVVKGGLSYEAWRGNAFWSTYANTAAPTSFPFFTWQKSNRLAQLTERMYLAWLNYTDVAAANLVGRIVITYTDGTTSANIDTVLTGAVKHRVTYFPCGAAQHDLEAVDATKIIYKWTVRIFETVGNTAVSAAFVYFADNRKDYNDAMLNYRNSLGGLDSVAVRGVIENNLEYESENAFSIAKFDYYSGDAVQPVEKTVNNRERLVYKGDVGYLGKEEQDRLRDAHLKREVWHEVSGKWLPVVNVTGNFKQRSSTDNLFSMPFEWMLGVPGNINYTPKGVNTGNATEAVNNVCNGTLSAISVTNTLVSGTYTAEINATITGATQLSYQIIGVHASPIIVAAGSLPVSVPGLISGGIYRLILRPVCADGSIGKRYVKCFIPNQPTYNAFVFNLSDDFEVIDIVVNTVTELTTNLNAGDGESYATASTGVSNVTLNFLNALHSTAKLIVGSNTYNGVITSTSASWTGVDITGGFIIELYD